MPTALVVEPVYTHAALDRGKRFKRQQVGAVYLGELMARIDGELQAAVFAAIARIDGELL